MNRLIFAAALSLAVTAWEMDKMAFVYHQVRHGARAPKPLSKLEPTAADLISFPTPGVLTASGMRARYLKGRHNRVRYTEQYSLLSEDYVPGELFTQSTD